MTSWSRSEKIAIASLCVSIVGVAAALAVVPEVRRAGRLSDSLTPDVSQSISSFTDSVPSSAFTEPAPTVDSTTTTATDTARLGLSSSAATTFPSGSTESLADSLSPTETTVTQDPPARGPYSEQRRRLLGAHGLTLQWIGWNPADWGRARVTENGGELFLEGEQRGRRDDQGNVMRTDFLEISGRIVALQDNGFTFDGEIVTQVHYIAGGAECKRTGTFHFVAYPGKRYWRMQEMSNPCDGVTDYVDVYF
jgi:hypothetical protein